jgi:hypothetical protein
MAKIMYAACDGGGLNTLAGAGGVLEIQIEPSVQMRYFEFPDGLGGSVHMVAPTPDKQLLVASSANVGQIFVMPRVGDRFEPQSYRVINTFNTLGPPELGTDAQTAMFDFLDNRHIACQYNRKLVKLDLDSGAIEVLADIGRLFPTKADILHQVTVTERFIVVDEVVKGGIFVFDRQNSDVSFLGDGFSGGHHLVYTDESGDTLVVRPAFGFQAVDAHLKIDDNAMSFYNLTKKTVATRCYSWEIANHHPTDIHLHEGFLYLSFAIPGSVAKVELSTGRIVARYYARPDCFTRYASMVLDGFYYLLDYATMRNRYERTNLTPFLLAHSWAMGRVSGTRAGFFAMTMDVSRDLLYVCHRGLNRVYCLRKSDLSHVWDEPLPSRKNYSRSPMKGVFYNAFPYFNRCLGVHHGSLVET